MSKHYGRAHGRILEVTEETLGSTLAQDAAVGVTVLYVDDAADFEDDGTGGWLSLNGQTLQYIDVDDDAGTITLLAGLTAAADDGDPVYVWSKIYDEAATLKTALVMVDGYDDNTDPVVATLGDAVQDLPEGLRGEAGENCTMHQVSADEWEITAVGGRPSSTKGASAVRFEADDVYVLTTADIAAGAAVMPLSHRPCDEGLVAFWGGVPQEPTEYTIDYDAQTITWPLGGFEQAGDRLWVHYAYTVSVTAPAVSVVVDWHSTGWRYLEVPLSDSTDRSATAFDDSTWAVGAAPFGNSNYAGSGWGAPATSWDPQSKVWARKNVTVPSGVSTLSVSYRIDNYITVWVDGSKVFGPAGPEGASAEALDAGWFPIAEGDHQLTVLFEDDATAYSMEGTYGDLQLSS